MKTHSRMLVSLLMISAIMSSPLQAKTQVNPLFDQARAAKTGADEYGMKRYVMAFLKRGTNRDRPKAEADELQRLHMANIGRLAEEGKLVLAGPFWGDGDLRGIYIFDVETIEQAQQLTATDPAIKAGSLVMELVPWYGSAALMEVNAIHNTLAKTLM
ncbi:YciI family protein [Shewanella phaeophyticola]|uniref:YciI family protein n=1 Tax=Shewanella phaeophyticola TaxID=2978345 RepID=A0ABT2P209_9GAMM|nr:YciI family protein [Shewanella sp. KJ10-1]MCT8986436.1 YciI family protein [Shewanella sp. KJ10-1]